MKEDSGPFFEKPNDHEMAPHKISSRHSNDASSRNKRVRADSKAPMSPSPLAPPSQSAVEINVDQFNVLIQRVYIWIAAISIMRQNNDVRRETHLAPTSFPVPSPFCNKPKNNIRLYSTLNPKPLSLFSFAPFLICN